MARGVGPFASASGVHASRAIERFEHYGWCKGTITGKVVDRRRTINKEAINFIAEFDIDDGASTDLSLDVSEYDPSPSADYQSWLLLQEAAG